MAGEMTSEGSLLLTAALLLLAHPAIVAAQVIGPTAESPVAESPALRAALGQARAAGLAEAKAWLRLGHYRGRPGAWTSEVDGAQLFVAPTGRTDPRAELEATLRAFFAPVGPAPAADLDPSARAKKRHALCRFPARFIWLAKTIPLRTQDLPAALCPELQEFVTRLNPSAAVLVFSSYYLNNPASAFGHTFLRLRSATPGTPDLLDYGIDFSADIDTQNPFVYTAKGLFGGFAGTFKRLPYYYKVREYNDYESRDLWEYELNLEPGALLMLLAHIWELGATYFDYYYMSENCSYHLLGLLEAANPQLDLLNRVGFPVIPADTVKALFANPQLVRRVRFRPSVRTQFRERLRLLGAAERDLVPALADDPLTPLPPGLSRLQQAQVLDAALDLIDVRHGRALIQKSDSQPADLKQALLQRRAQLGIATATPEPSAPQRKRPELGHGSRRFGTALGATGAGEGFAALDLRLSMHDLADPPAGLPDGAQLEFLSGRLRWWLDQRRLDLEDFALVRATSLTPVDRYDLRISWKMSVGAATRRYDCVSCVAGRVVFGGGGTMALGSAVALFATGDVEGLYAPLGGWSFPLRGGIGATAGLLLRAGPVAGVVTGELYHYPGQDGPRTLSQLRAVTRWGFLTNYALSLEGGLNQIEADARLGALVYF